MPGRLPFPASTFPVTFKGRTTLFVRPENPDAVLETIAEDCYEKDQFLPYWAEHWPSADVLLSFLEGCDLPTGTLACELGSGLGIITAAVAPHVATCIATDISPAAGRFARENISRTVTQPAVTCADWRSPPFKIKFNLIFGSDVLYEARWINPVAAFVHEHLAPDGTAYIADPCRSHWEQFKETCMHSGMRVTTAHRALARNGKITVEVAAIVKTQSTPSYRPGSVR